MVTERLIVRQKKMSGCTAVVTFHHNVNPLLKKVESKQGTKSRNNEGRKKTMLISIELHVSNPSLSFGRSTLISFGGFFRESESFLRAAVGVSERGLSGISFWAVHCFWTAVSMSGVRFSRSISSSSRPFNGEMRPAKLVSIHIACKHPLILRSTSTLLHKSHAMNHASIQTPPCGENILHIYMQ